MPTIFITPSSSNLEQCEYDELTGALLITFKSGDMYEYQNVPPETFRRLQSARSAGQFFITNIREAYDFEKVS